MQIIQVQLHIYIQHSRAKLNTPINQTCIFWEETGVSGENTHKKNGE